MSRQLSSGLDRNGFLHAWSTRSFPASAYWNFHTSITEVTRL